MNVQELDLKRLCLWTRVFQAFRLALAPMCLLLGGLALVLISIGRLAISYLPFAPENAAAAVVWPWDQSLRIGPDLISLSPAINPLLAPANSIWRPLMGLFSEPATWSSVVFHLTELLWAIAVWSLFSAAICRVFALRFARDDRLGIRAALRFAGRRYLSFFCAPLLPLLGVAIFWGLCMVGGGIGRIPAAGPVIVGAFWFVALIFAAIAGLILIGLMATWPLMFATVAVEDSDAFDGFSRAFSFLFSRTWYFAWLVVLIAGYFVVAAGVLALVVNLVVHLAWVGVGSGMGADASLSLFELTPPAVRPGTVAAAAEGQWGAGLVGFWMRLLAVLWHGFVASFFFASATIAYFLLRKRDDGTALDEVYLADSAEDDELLPLVGVAASDQPPIERPVHPPVDRERDADQPADEDGQ